ncbi:MAG: HAD family phosphatase [Clostridia bacterium]|nr:HAD family phosphatase [Clostridia bacterium]
MIKNIVFDMGNVLLCYDANAILGKYLDNQEDIDIFQNVLMRSYEWAEYDRGTVDKQSFIPVIEKMPAHLQELANRIVLGQCFAEKEMPPFPQTEELVRKLRANGYGLYLLSNAGQDFYHYSKYKPALQYFDFCFVSSDYKLLKPEPEIYEKFFEVTGLDRSECVFIDDVQANVDGSIAAGMDAICFTPSREDIGVLYDALRARGVQI